MQTHQKWHFLNALAVSSLLATGGNSSSQRKRQMITGSKRLVLSSSMHFSPWNCLCICILLITSRRLQGTFVFFSLCSPLWDVARLRHLSMDPQCVLWVVEIVLPSCVLADAALVRHPLNRVAAKCSCVSPQRGIYFKACLWRESIRRTSKLIKLFGVK